MGREKQGHEEGVIYRESRGCRGREREGGATEALWAVGGGVGNIGCYALVVML